VRGKREVDERARRKERVKKPEVEAASVAEPIIGMGEET